MDPQKLQAYGIHLILANELLNRILNSPNFSPEIKQTYIKKRDLTQNIFHKEKCRQTSCDD